MDSLVPREDGERSSVFDDNGACAGAIFSDFEALNEDQVAQLIGKAAKKKNAPYILSLPHCFLKLLMSYFQLSLR